MNPDQCSSDLNGPWTMTTTIYLFRIDGYLYLVNIVEHHQWQPRLWRGRANDEKKVHGPRTAREILSPSSSDKPPLQSPIIFFAFACFSACHAKRSSTRTYKTSNLHLAIGDAKFNSWEGIEWGMPLSSRVVRSGILYVRGSDDDQKMPPVTRDSRSQF